MKNIEKYTNTKDALEAYNNSVKNVPFDEWLECEYEEPPKPTLIEAARLVANEYYICGIPTEKSLRILGEAVDRELKKPVRNFDKYKTAKEAYRAFSNVCQKENGCLNCRFKNTKYGGCSILWAYEDAEKEVSQND